MTSAGSASIELARMGSFHVGGRSVELSGLPSRKIALSQTLTDVTYDPNGLFWIDQAYVQYFVPARLAMPLPLLLVHGGALTGACWETTPDGRPGWTQRLLESGFATCVIDNVERGRAGFCAIPGQWQSEPLMRSASEAWSMFRFGAPEDFARRVGYAGQQFPIESFDALWRQMVPRWLTTTAAQVAALSEAIERIGPCILIAHSQGGGLAAHALMRSSGLVRACVFLEPHGVPQQFDPETVAGRPCLTVAGDFLDRDAFWRGLSPQFAALSEAWKAAGGIAHRIDLVAEGIRGNSHMPMMDRNSDIVLSLITGWLRRQAEEGRLA